MVEALDPECEECGRHVERGKSICDWCKEEEP